METCRQLRAIERWRRGFRKKTLQPTLSSGGRHLASLRSLAFRSSSGGNLPGDFSQLNIFFTSHRCEFPQGSRGFYIRAHRSSLSLHSPDMLSVRCDLKVVEMIV